MADPQAEETDPQIEELRSYLPELYRSIREPRKSSDPPSGGKPHSRPPLDVNALDLYDDACHEIDCHDMELDHTCNVDRVLEVVKRHLGVDAPFMKIASTSCHVCEGQLIVAADASTDVMCTTEGCGNVYRQEDWVEILYSQCDAT